jgi:hypothetical protein
MEYGQKADPGTKVLGLGGDLGERLCGGAEEEAVDYALVGQGQRRQLMGQGEDDVEVGDRQ